jgi:type II secretory pathway pseudopilin PulG
MKTLKYNGFGIVEVLVAAVVLAFVAGMAAYGISSLQTARKESQVAAQRSTYAAMQQDAVLRGVDVGVVDPMSDVAVGNLLTSMAAASVEASPVVGKAGVEGVNFDVGSGVRAGNAGLRLVAHGVNLSVDYAALQPPSWPMGLSGLGASSFPVTVDLVIPANPVGTVYRYTTDGSEPDISSPVWSPMTYATPDDVPDVLRARAYNDGGLFEPSSVATVYPKIVLEVAYGRESLAALTGAGRSIYTFSYEELTGLNPVTGGAGVASGNGIVLAGHPLVSSDKYSLHYTYDGSQPTVLSNEHPGMPFTISDVGAFEAGVTLRVVAVSKSPKYLDSAVQSIPLVPYAIQLDPVAFSPLPGEGLLYLKGVVTLLSPGANALVSGAVGGIGFLAEDSVRYIEVW